MTSAENRNDLVTTQEKLEWVTPQISLMGASDTEKHLGANEAAPSPFSGPS